MTEENSTDYAEDIWTRLLFMLLFVFIYSAAEFALFLVAVIQFGFVLITRNRNEKLVSFSGNLAVYIYQIIQFFVLRTNNKPFPFADWPSDDRI